MMELKPKTTKTDIVIEALKVAVLCVLLYFAFVNAEYPDVLWVPVIALFKAGVIVFAYLLGQNFANTYTQGWRNYLLLFYGVAILTLMTWGALGTYHEGGDPLFGGGNLIVDYVPTDAERANAAITVFFVLLVPAFYGAYKKRKLW